MLIEQNILCTNMIKPKFNWKLLCWFQISRIVPKKKENLFSYKNLSWTMTLNERSFGWNLETRKKWSAIDANSLFQSCVAIYKLNFTNSFIGSWKQVILRISDVLQWWLLLQWRIIVLERIISQRQNIRGVTVLQRSAQNINHSFISAAFWRHRLYIYPNSLNSTPKYKVQQLRNCFHLI